MTTLLLAYNPKQLRVPKGMGRLSGRWMDTPWKVITDFLAGQDFTPDTAAVPLSRRPPAHLTTLATPEDKEKFKAKYGKAIPPSWTDVWMTLDAPDDAQGMIARGVDKAGRFQSIYTQTREAMNAAQKFQRIKQFAEAKGALDEALADVGENGTLAALRLMHLTGIRVGSTTEQRGKVPTYGAATLQVRHAERQGDSIKLSFIAKEGIPAEYVIDDPELARFIGDRLDTGDSPDALLFGTTSSRTETALRKITGNSAFKNHDLRTALANRIAHQEVQKLTPATNLAEFKKQRLAVGEAVAAQLRNKRDQALNSYISPVVFTDLYPEQAS